MQFVKHRHGYKGSLSAKSGIKNYLFDKYGIPVYKKGGEKKLKKIMLAFLKANDTKWREGFTNNAANYNARRIQANFPNFAEWLKTQYPKDET